MVGVASLIAASVQVQHYNVSMTASSTSQQRVLEPDEESLEPRSPGALKAPTIPLDTVAGRSGSERN